MASVALVTAYNSDGLLLLGRRKSEKTWTLPGGHIEPGEDPKQAAARELLEETGLHATSISFIKEYTGSNGVHLHCFSAYVHGEPHGELDPDNEVDTGDWKWVDVSEGLPSNIYRNLQGPTPESGDNFVAQLFDLKKKEDDSESTDLIKMRTPPRFPGLGVPDDRREIPIITTPEQLKSKQLGMRAIVNVKHPGAAESKERTLQDPSMGMVSTVPGSRTGFARGTALRQETASKHPLAAIDYLNNNADLGTQQHENFHMMMNRIEELHGSDARRMTAKMLHEGIPQADRKTVIQHSMAHRMMPDNTPRYHEESLALLHNYLNNPGKREAFHTNAKHTPEYAREFGNSMKRAHKFVQRLAPRIVPSDVMTKGEPPHLTIGPEDQVGPQEPPGLDKQSINYTCPHGLQVFLVSGEFCRNHYDSDMVQGANPFRYKWVPKTEIWVDNDTPRAEIPYVIQHECNESERMRGGESYEQAHDQAKGIEDRERHREDPGELGKAESEVDRLLSHPDPIERRMALRLDSATTPNVNQAALDTDPQVHEAAIDHPLFGEIEGHNLLSAKEGSGGQYPTQQQLAFLNRSKRVTPGHLNTAVLTATDAPSDARDAILNAVIKHPSLSPANVRTVYRGYGATHNQRYELMNHPAVPQDVLEHAIDGAMLFPSEHSQSLAMKAAGHKNLAPEAREALVRKVGDNSPPNVVQLAVKALSSGPVSPELGEDLHMQRMLRPSSPFAHALMGAYLKGPSATTDDLDRALRIQHPDVVAGAMDHRDFGNRHLQMLMPAPSVSPEIHPIAKSESHERSSIANLVNEPIVRLQHGIDLSIKPCFQAARFLSGGAEVDLGAMRRALYVEDGNIEAAALRAYGFTVNDDNLKALKAIQDLKELGKAEEDTEPNAQQITNPHSEGEDVAQAVARAFENHFVFRVKMGGKHSSGSMLAHDEQSGTWLLKSGSGGAGAAAGASQDPSEPNAREAAWHHIAKAWGVDEFYPRAELVNIDGQNYACMKLLPLSYRSLEDLRQSDSGEPRRILEPYLRDGSLHMWSVMDMVLGSADDHLGNVLTDAAKPTNTERHRHQDEPRISLVPEKQAVVLIDHGSAFAGPAFDPAHDQASFTPGYLRVWSINMNFNALPPDEKLRHLPRVDRKTALEIKAWFDGLDINKMVAICQRYGTNYGPQVDRMNKLRALCEVDPIDLATNKMWCTI